MVALPGSLNHLWIMKLLNFLKGYSRLSSDADRARDRRQWRLASELYRTYLEREPMDFGRWVQCGHAEKELGRFDRALSCYLMAQSLRDDDADLHLQIGHLYKLMGRLEEASTSYAKSIELNLEGDDARRELLALKPYYPSAPRRAASDGAIGAVAGPAVPSSILDLPRQFLSDADRLLYAFENELSGGRKQQAAVLLRALLRLRPLEAVYWEKLAGLLEQLEDVKQAKRCREIAQSLSSRRSPPQQTRSQGEQTVT